MLGALQWRWSLRRRRPCRYCQCISGYYCRDTSQFFCRNWGRIFDPSLQFIARISFAFALSIGQASQIQTGYFVGKGWIDDITLKVQKYFVVSFIASLIITITVYLFRFKIIDVFTQDPEVILLVASLITGSILLEAGRVFNLIFISALKATGDIKFPVQMGILSMWGIGVVMSYFLGIHWGYGVLGAWLAVAMDEWFRGLIMAYRWRAKKWIKYTL